MGEKRSQKIDEGIESLVPSAAYVPDEKKGLYIILWLSEGGGGVHLSSFFIAHNTPPPHTHKYCTHIFIFTAVTFKLAGLARV